MSVTPAIMARGAERHEGVTPRGGCHESLKVWAAGLQNAAGSPQPSGLTAFNPSSR